MLLPKISIIVLQFNNSRDTLRCLESVKKQDYANFDVIIVDNSSSIEHVNSIRLFIENEKNSVRPINYNLILGTSNLGYAGGNNLGIKQALYPVRSLARDKGASLKDLGGAISKRAGSGAQYVLILNPDVVLEKNTLSRLVSVAESDRKIGILGPAINEGSGRIIFGGRIQWYKPELKHFLKLVRSRKWKADGYVVGACMLISKSVLQLVGVFDERYFLYFEDADLCLRAKKAGWKLAIVPKAIVHHRPSSSTNKLGAPLLLRYHFRNAHLFVFKNERCICKYIFLPLWSMLIIIKQIAKIIMGHESEISKAILAGVLDFYGKKFGKIDNINLKM